MGVTVLVPGYSGRLRLVERWRIRVAEQTLEAHSGGVLVISGGGGEAERLHGLCRAQGPIYLETDARSTRENVEYSLPYLSGSESIAIASDRLHRRRATKYLADVDSRLVECVVPPTIRQPSGLAMDIGGGVYAALRWIRGRSTG